MSVPLRRDEGGLLPVLRTFWSRCMLAVGSVGLSLCGLWWLFVGTLLLVPDPVGEDVQSPKLTLLGVSALITLLFLIFLRWGLSGRPRPPEPKLAPVIPLRREPHLRLVRTTS